MIKFIDVTGKTEDEAIQSALAQLKMDRDDVSVEILERAKAGFLGIGSAPARVRVSYDDGKAEEVKPVEKPAAPKPEKKVEPASAPKAVPMYAPEVLQKKEPRAAKEERSGRPAREDRRENRAPRAERAERPAPQPKPIVDLGEECHDEKSEQIRAFLKGLLEHMDSAAEVKVYESEKDRYKVFLEGEKLGALIGRRGETLDAIQQLTNYSINRGSEKNRARVQVDAENYREKREQSLERLAEKVAGKVTKYRRNVTLEPMNAYERHVIHTALQDTPSVTTFSIGTEPNRRVVVSYDRTKA
ncbi:MAG TPA: protein jag [Oscillibacter sp.]|nr:protein jag [Oscillibacter sp.]